MNVGIEWAREHQLEELRHRVEDVVRERELLRAALEEIAAFTPTWQETDNINLWRRPVAIAVGALAASGFTRQPLMSDVWTPERKTR